MSTKVIHSPSVSYKVGLRELKKEQGRIVN
jgi:hypothetical protein